MAAHDTERDRFSRLLFYTMVLLVGFLAYQVVRPFLGALGWAAVFAMLFQPVQARLAKRLGSGRASVLTTLLVAVAIIGPLVTVISILVREVSAVTAHLQASGVRMPTPARLQELWDGVRARVPLPLPADIAAAAQSTIQRVASTVGSGAAAVLANVAGVVGQLLVMLFVLFFFLRDAEAIVGAIRRLLPFDEARRDRLIEQTHNLVVASVGATFAVAVTQGLVAGVAFWLLGFNAPVLWGTMTAFFSLVPLVGASIIWAPAALWLFFSGDVTRGLILLGVGAGVISMVDNVVRPLVLSGRTAMSGLVVLIGLLGGVSAFGFIGLVLGPVVIVTATTLLEAAAGPPPGAPSPPPRAG